MCIRDNIKIGFKRTKILYLLTILSFVLTPLVPTFILLYFIFFIMGSYRLGQTTMAHFIFEEKTKQQIKTYVNKMGFILLFFAVVSFVLEYFGLEFISVLTSGIVGVSMGMIIVALIYERTYLR